VGLQWVYKFNLVTLLNNIPEIQFVALRNIKLLLQKNQRFLTDVKVFFCKYHDPIYVKVTKLEILACLADDTNVAIIISELKEFVCLIRYATEVDVDFVRKSVRAIGRCAIKIPEAADRCVETLVAMVKTKVDYVVQEAIIVIKDIFRKYPNRFESILGILCENLGVLNEPEAKASMVWIVGEYSDRIENADVLLSEFLDGYKDETQIVQQSLLTAVVKLFIKRPVTGQKLVPRILKYSTEDIDNPDIRDRGFMYWRMLSTDPVLAKQIVFGIKPVISTESDNFDPTMLSRLVYSLSTLASVTYQPPIFTVDFGNHLEIQHIKSMKLMEIYATKETVKIVKRAEVHNGYETDLFNVNDRIVRPKSGVPEMELIGQMGLLDIKPQTGYYAGLPLDLFSEQIPDMNNELMPVDVYAMYPSNTIQVEQQYENIEVGIGGINYQQNTYQQNTTPFAGQYNNDFLSDDQHHKRIVIPDTHNPFIGVTKSQDFVAEPLHTQTSTDLNTGGDVVLDPFARKSDNHLNLSQTKTTEPPLHQRLYSIPLSEHIQSPMLESEPLPIVLDARSGNGLQIAAKCNINLISHQTRFHSSRNASMQLHSTND
jgi:hypothetical protein